MTHEITRRIAMMTLFATCALLVVLTLALGLGADAAGALRQGAPLMVVGAIAFTVLLAEPVRK